MKIAAHHERIEGDVNAETRKKIGIITGSGSGIDLWGKILCANRAMLGDDFRGDLNAPNVTIFSEPALGLSMALQQNNAVVWDCLRSAAQAMAQRVDYYAIACNTLNYYQPQLISRSGRGPAVNPTRATEAKKMSKKHIGLIYTGGTVGMAKTDQGYAPMDDFASALDGLLSNSCATLPQYTLYEYETPIDSTNATPADWQKVGRDIAARYAGHDGFVVLHGTDTMAYTAAALSFMLQGLRKPVIVTGSQIPLGEVRSDALQNLITALQLAASSDINEVALYFNQRLLRGNRSTKVSTQRFDAFDSPNYPWLGQVEIGVQLHASALLPRAAQEKFELPEYGSGHVLSVRFLPGMPVQVVQAMLALQPRALILECYGAGNAPDYDPALLELLAKANADGVVLIACSQCLHGSVALGAYATGAGLARAGVIGALDMTFEAIFVKLHHLFAMGLNADAVRVAFLRDLSGELSETE